MGQKKIESRVVPTGTSTFLSPTVGEVSLPDLIDRIHEFFCCDGFKHKVIIGTDSSPADNSGTAEMVTAVVIHRVGHGGIYFWTHAPRKNLHTLRDRMYAEALRSLEVAGELIKGGLITMQETPGVLEIHVDVGPNGPTRQMIQELVGMIRGNGFDVHTKPNSFAASKVADRHT